MQDLGVVLEACTASDEPPCRKQALEPQSPSTATITIPFTKVMWLRAVISILLLANTIH